MDTNALAIYGGADSSSFFDASPGYVSSGAMISPLPPVFTVSRNGVNTNFDNAPAGVSFVTSPFAAPAAQGNDSTGHSTRDAILGTIQTGLSILPQLFGKGNDAQVQQLQQQLLQQQALLQQQGGAAAGVNVGVNPNGISGGLQLNMTTILIVGLAAVLLLKK